MKRHEGALGDIRLALGVLEANLRAAQMRGEDAEAKRLAAGIAERRESERVLKEDGGHDG